VFHLTAEKIKYKQMQFPILIAHYNNFEYFKDCYKSIQNQTYQNFEIIIVDDCSTDGSFEKLTDFTKNNPKIKLFRNEENRGVGFTKRKCVELATGEICGFADPDDKLSENALFESINNYDENTIATYSQIYMCDEFLNVKEIFSQTKKVKNYKSLFLNLHFEVAHFFTFRKSAYEKTSGINPELSSAVDQDLYLKLYEIRNFKFIKKPIYFYRLHKKGVSQEQSKKEKLNKNWDVVIRETLKRRNIDRIYGKNISEIPNLPEFIYKKENTFFKKLKRKFL
jgi:glycosyltransferase involved in cell wall biosynthesis